MLLMACMVTASGHNVFTSTGCGTCSLLLGTVASESGDRVVQRSERQPCFEK